MAVMVIFRSRDVSRAQYDAIMETLDLDNRPPEGSIVHLCAFGPDGISVTDAWDSREAWEVFARDRLASAFQKVGVNPDPPQVLDVHNMRLNALMPEIAPTPA